MSLKSVPIWVCANHSHSQLGISDLVHKHSGWFPLNLRVDFGRYRKRECFPLLAQSKKTPVEDEKPVLGSAAGINQTQITESIGLHKDLNSLPRPLSATDLSSSPNEGLKARVAYQALDQCEMTLNKLGVVRVNADDTASAALIVASDGIRDTGAVASSRAAEIYGLDILAERIQDDSDNITRFLILSREPIIPGTDRPHKTSIVFTLEEGPGILFKALAVFSLRGINLSKIESRPQGKRPLRVVDDNNNGSAKYFDYLFYIDFEASMAEPRAQYALGHLQEFAGFIRVLGCYPMDLVL